MKPAFNNVQVTHLHGCIGQECSSSQMRLHVVAQEGRTFPCQPRWPGFQIVPQLGKVQSLSPISVSAVPICNHNEMQLKLELKLNVHERTKVIIIISKYSSISISATPLRANENRALTQRLKNVTIMSYDGDVAKFTMFLYLQALYSLY